MTAATAVPTPPTAPAPVNIFRAQQIAGWMSDSELRWLAEQAQSHSRIVELGSFRGRSTRALADHCPGTVYAIDTWCTFDGVNVATPQGMVPIQMSAADAEAIWVEFIANLSDHITSGRVQPIRADHAAYSQFPSEWLRGDGLLRPDMIFIDGSHDYDSVRRDILAWRERLAPGGLLCGHDYDYGWPGVVKAVRELLPGHRHVEGTAIWYWKEGMDMPVGLMKRDIAELRAVAGKPVLAAAPSTPLIPSRAPDASWMSAGGPATRKLALAIMMPQSGRYNPPEWGLALALLQAPPNAKYAILATKGERRDDARNDLVHQARNAGARLGLFLDDDCPPPPETLLKLMYTLDNAPDDVIACAGIYTSKTTPPYPLVFQADGDGPFWRWKAGQVFECERIATGCMMIRLDKLDALEEPWFRDVEGMPEHPSLHITDDIYFCRKARAAGFKILAHGGVLPTHWDEDGNAYYLPPDSYPFREEK